MKQIIRVISSIVLLTVASCQEVRTVRVKVTEEDGSPLKDADVTVWFSGYQPEQSKSESGRTDEKGVCVAKGFSLLHMSVQIEREGYYKTQSGRLSRKNDHDLTFVLRRINNPIPLYAKRFRGNLPGIGGEYGFDFEAGDWVAPEGGGKRADILLRVRVVEGDHKPAGRIDITFPEREEGLAVVTPENGYLPPSELVMPPEAFEIGYLGTIGRIESGYENKSKAPNESYFFRTRMKKDERGVVFFNYSKMLDGYKFVMGGGRFLEEPYRSKYPGEYGQIEFTYYFNPIPNNRNLEFDIKKNLFKDLDISERVDKP